jgi:hypothetical protein
VLRAQLINEDQGKQKTFSSIERVLLLDRTEWYQEQEIGREKKWPLAFPSQFSRLSKPILLVLASVVSLSFLSFTFPA